MRQTQGLSQSQGQSLNRRLVPAQPKPEGLVHDTREIVKRPRVGIRQACVKCHTKKRRCDGTKPRCFQCAKENSECLYRNEKPEKNRKALELLYRLRNSPEDEALDLLRRLRSGADPMLMLAEEADYARCLSRHRPSAVAVARALPRSAVTTVEVELAVLHPLVYPPPGPRDPAPCDQATLRRHVLPLSEHWARANDQSEQSQSFKPKCDSRLCDLQISYWTGVPISNDLAVRALSSYFELTHPVLGLFDHDLFIDDLVHMRLCCCSPFLVSAVLAYACQSYTGVEVETAAYARAFFNEAERIWRAERSTDSPINVAATFMLSVSSHTYLGNRRTIDILLDGRDMAERLGLFGVREAPAGFSALYPLDTQSSRAVAHIAWGAYCWLTLNTFYCQVNPIVYPPLFPIPSSDGASDTDYMGHTFTSLCGFWSIMQDFAAVYYAHRQTSKPLRDSISIAFAEGQYQKLLSWVDGLPPEMALHEGCPDHVFIFHVLFHCAILDIFETFNYDEQRNHRLRSFTSADASITGVLRTSTNQLKQLVLDCRLHRPRALLVTHANSAMLHVANAILRDAASLESSSFSGTNRRFHFLAALANCADMYVCFPVFGSIGRGLLSMAMRDGLLSSKDAKELIVAIEERGVHHDVSVKRPGGAFAIDFELATREHEEAQAYAMAQQFDELSLFSEIMS